MRWHVYEEIDAVLGFDQIRFRKLEEEHADFLCFVHPHKSNSIPGGLPEPIVSQFAELKFIGTPEILSETSINWESIYTTARLTKTPPSEEIQSIVRAGYHSKTQKCDIFRSRWIYYQKPVFKHARQNPAAHEPRTV
jgi:hypothetical protein